MKIITIGSATIDVYLQSKGFKEIKSEKFLTGVGECLALGSKNDVSDIFVDTGGGATNAAVTFKNLGINTKVLSRVGDDLFGREILKVLKDRRIDTKNIQIDKTHRTSYSTLLLMDGQRSILVYRGASNYLEMKKCGANWFYISSLGGNLKLLEKFLSFARAKKIKVAYNPGGGELKAGLVKFKKLVKDIEVLNMNREEASSLCGTDYKRMDIMIKKLNGLARYIVITDGAKGAHCLYDNKIYFVPSLGTKPKNTTGAGDAFGSGFVAGLALKKNIKYALQLAILNSDGVIRETGAKNGLLQKLPNSLILNKVKIKFEVI